ncbi:N-6 DNA methylase [Methylomonas sp. SURF-2]|uniref:site-specific DNA-methyltransferase (adenine-specific) n=1 Tax=Methylomonas subterranea TaxID=2952225 RepID=A0ABT1TCN4_9GAMM|nr:N-6 DNA methylase [Methylomonas sp. SURF-2]MCQ8103226.1 N-6 DNA methylase [Methylomonas sp. SURF-2]
MEFAKSVPGQEINPETNAICKADLLLKGEGEEAENIVGGADKSTLSADRFPAREFDFMLSNPPYGKSWKTDLERMGGKAGFTDPRFMATRDGDPEYKLITRSSDGQLMFLVNKPRKMKHNTPLGSRIALAHNGSALFTGDAGQGESNIRREALEVHFAVDDSEVAFCTHLTGKTSWFLPFNQGWNSGAGNPPNPDGLKSDYLWKRVLAKELLANIIENFAQIVEEEGERGKNKRKQVFPRFHQLCRVRALSRRYGAEDVGRRYLIQHRSWTRSWMFASKRANGNWMKMPKSSLKAKPRPSCTAMVSSVRY